MTTQDLTVDARSELAARAQVGGAPLDPYSHPIVRAAIRHALDLAHLAELRPFAHWVSTALLHGKRAGAPVTPASARPEAWSLGLPMPNYDLAMLASSAFQAATTHGVRAEQFKSIAQRFVELWKRATVEVRLMTPPPPHPEIDFFKHGLAWSLANALPDEELGPTTFALILAAIGTDDPIVRAFEHDLTVDNVKQFTERLIKVARQAMLDRHEGIALPDIALLALIQHHGAATPLLDVSLDPIVALYMAVVSPSPSDEDEDGVLFAIKKPTVTIAPHDSRHFRDIYSALPTNGVAFYSAPDVSERLRIQRGHFLVGRVSAADARCTLPLTLDPRRPLSTSWIWKRMSSRGKQGKVTPATTDIAVFRITAKFKARIRLWLEERSGLTRDFVYPTPWHQPHLDLFASSHKRTAAF